MPKIRDLASSPVYCVRETDDLTHARQEMLSRDVDKLVVLNADDAVAGILTVTDLVQDGANLRTEDRPRLRVVEGSVSTAMTRNPFTVRESMDAMEVLTDFVRRDLVAAPVMSGNGDLVGIVTAHDLMPVVKDSVEGRVMVRNAMNQDVVRLHRHDSLSHAAHAIAEANAGAAVVTEAESDVERVGVVTLESILYHYALEPRSPREKAIRTARRREYGGRNDARHVNMSNAVVEDAMWQDHPTINADSGAGQAANVILTQRVDVVPVVDGESVVGMVTKRGLLKAARQAVSAEA